MMDKIKKCISYCINDATSCGRLWVTRLILDEVRALSKISCTNLESCFYRAGGMKVRNTLLTYNKKYNL